MTVMDGGETMTAKDLVELTHVSWHVLRIDRRILNDGDRLGVSWDVGQQAQGGLRRFQTRFWLAPQTTGKW